MTLCRPTIWLGRGIVLLGGLGRSDLGFNGLRRRGGRLGRSDRGLGDHRGSGEKGREKGKGERTFHRTASWVGRFRAAPPHAGTLPTHEIETPLTPVGLPGVYGISVNRTPAPQRSGNASSRFEAHNSMRIRHLSMVPAPVPRPLRPRQTRPSAAPPRIPASSPLRRSAPEASGSSRHRPPAPG